MEDNIEEFGDSEQINYNSIDFLARFACLYEGVNIACDKAEQLGIKPEKSQSWIKPLAFQKYIKEREDDMRYQVKSWHRLGKDDVHAKSVFFGD